MQPITQNGLILDDYNLQSTTANGVSAFSMTHEDINTGQVRGFAATIYADSNGTTWLDWVATQDSELYNKGEIILDMPAVSTADGINPQKLARWVADKLVDLLTNNPALD